MARNLGVLGEAAYRLPEPVRAAAPGIEWRKIIDSRNILIYEYFGISLPLVWDVVANKLGSPRFAARALLSWEG